MQQRQVISSSDDSTVDRKELNQKTAEIHNVFGKDTDADRDPFREELRKLLWSYEKKHLDSRDRRILEGIKSKNIIELDKKDKKEDLR